MSSVTLKSILDMAQQEVVCGEEFVVQVQYSVKVGDCDNHTADEDQKMIRGVKAKLMREAEGHCRELDDCPWPNVVGGELVSEVCGRNDAGENIWSSTWDFTVKCVP